MAMACYIFLRQEMQNTGHVFALNCEPFRTITNGRLSILIFSKKNGNYALQSIWFTVGVHGLSRKV